MEKLLHLLSRNPKMSAEELADRTGLSAAEVEEKIRAYEENGTILGYHLLLDAEKSAEVPVRALIEVKVTPYKGHGFEKVARHLAQFSEVRSVSLMSGGFDLLAEVEGSDMRGVALFVAEKLSVIDGVMATATHFVLRRYKYEGVDCRVAEKDERGYIL